MDFLGQRVRGTGPAILEILNRSKDQIHILAYDITSNAVEFLNELELALTRGRKITLIVDGKRIGERADLRSRFLEWKSKFEYFTFVEFFRDDKMLHAKVVIADRNVAVIGSANFTAGGFENNYEVGVLLKGKEVRTLASIIDKIAESPTLNGGQS